MNPRLLALAAAVAIAATTAPAQATCDGCGGVTVLPGSAAASLAAKGVNQTNVVTASCRYDSVLNPSTGARGTLSLDVRGDSVAASYTSLAATCSLDAGYTAVVSGSQAGPTAAYGSTEEVPPDLFVGRICLKATATWQFSPFHDSAAGQVCSSGVHGGGGGVQVDIPIGS